MNRQRRRVAPGVRATRRAEKEEEGVARGEKGETDTGRELRIPGLLAREYNNARKKGSARWKGARKIQALPRLHPPRAGKSGGGVEGRGTEESRGGGEYASGNDVINKGVNGVSGLMSVVTPPPRWTRLEASPNALSKNFTLSGDQIVFRRFRAGCFLQGEPNYPSRRLPRVTVSQDLGPRECAFVPDERVRGALFLRDVSNEGASTSPLFYPHEEFKSYRRWLEFRGGPPGLGETGSGADQPIIISGDSAA
ncbi:hypothetical protein KM043_009614 [Ampulex compressa]|nr:hypothetical protein KM043_009614 [Ampulex compressa]